MPEEFQKDIQTVTPAGDRVGELIDGVNIHYSKTHIDERGTLCEMYNPAWGLLDAPVIYVYQITVQPGKVRGWVVHEKQDDRVFISSGSLKLVLYDAREDSPTHELLNEFLLGDNNRATVVIPRGVFHAFQNVGSTVGVFNNMPTESYNYENPDKIRLPLKNDVIPYSFEDARGW